MEQSHRDYSKFFEELIKLCNRERVYIVIGQYGSQNDGVEMGGFYLRDIRSVPTVIPNDSVILLPYFQKDEVNENE